MDGTTTGAAEVLAASLANTKRGDLVGDRTFGLASEQKLIPLDDGAALFLTVARLLQRRWQIHLEEGVTPTEVVRASAASADDSDDGEDVITTPGTPKDSTIGPRPLSSEDPVLRRASELLKSPVKTSRLVLSCPSSCGRAEHSQLSVTLLLLALFACLAACDNPKSAGISVPKHGDAAKERATPHLDPPPAPALLVSPSFSTISAPIASVAGLRLRPSLPSHSFLPSYHANSREIAEEAHRRGYQIMLHLPMQSLATECPNRSNSTPECPRPDFRCRGRHAAKRPLCRRCQQPSGFPGHPPMAR